MSLIGGALLKSNALFIRQLIDSGKQKVKKNQEEKE